MNKEIINKNSLNKLLIIFGIGLFLRTFYFDFDLPLETFYKISISFLIIIGGLINLIELKNSEKKE